jgi:UDP-3-O-[3-hydroxymyristoyl] glucosamine N-acyltransferase
MQLSELARAIEASVVGDASADVSGVATLDEATPSDVSFLANPRYADRLATTGAAAVIVAPGITSDRLNLLVAKDPYLAYCRAVVTLIGHRKHPFSGVHPLAHVDKTATVGEGTVVYPHCFVGPRVRIGRDCILYPGVVVYDDCVLGDRVTLHANTVIGQDGFGYATSRGVHHKIPQVGNVILEDDVEIGAGCAIERAAMGSTIIGQGTKFADLVSIGHGTKIGPHGLVVSLVGIAGSATIGHHVTIGGQAAINGHTRVGDQVTIAGQSGVVGDVEDRAVLLGSPALPIRQARRVYVAQARLPELIERVRGLEQQLAALQKGDSPPFPPASENAGEPEKGD